MPRLRRIHFASIGHRDARLAPLTLDLTDAGGQATDSVIWLRNGGGKSSLLNLFFSIFRPSRGDFLGKAVDGQSRHLTDYVKAEDTAFVVTEWEIAAAQLGLGLDEPATRLVGQVMEWRGRRRSSDTSHLQRRFFSVRTDAGIGWKNLPVHGIAASPLTSMDTFLEWLRRVREERPAREVVIEEQQGRWIRHLESIHLDPELFRYQLRMNRREGAADEAFRFTTARAFVEFFLQLTLDTSRADQVSANLSELREKLHRLPGHRDEHVFLRRATGALAPLVEAADSLRKAQADKARVRTAASSLAGALGDAVQQENGRIARLNERLKDLEGRRLQLTNDNRRLSRWAEGLERRAVELDLEEAECAHAKARGACANATRRRRLMDAVPLWRERENLAARCLDLRQSLEQEQDEQAPMIARLKAHGSALQAALMAAISDADRLARVRETNVSATEEAREKARARENAAREALAAARKDAEHTRGCLAERDRARERLVRNELIAHREGAKDALERWSTALDRARERKNEAAELAESLDSERNALRETLANHGLDLAVILEQERAKRGHLEEARAERESLETDRDTVEVDEQGERADVFARGLEDRLMSAAAADESRLRRSAVEGAEDKRAAAGWDQSSLLPPTLDVERVVARLRKEGIDAFSAQAYLADNLRENVENKAALLAADPARFSGVLVPLGTIERVRAVPNLGRGLRAPVAIAVVSLEAGDGAAPPVVAGPEGSGTYDHAAAASEVIAVRERSRKRLENEDVWQARAQHLRATAASVGRFVERWGDGRWDALCERVDMLVAKADRIRAEMERTRQRETELEEALQNARAAQGLANTEVATAEEAMRRLNEFIERHEQHVEARRSRLQFAERTVGEAGREIDAATQDEASARQRRDDEVRLRDEVRAHARALRREHAEVEWVAPVAPVAGDIVPPLASARERYAEQHAIIQKKFGESRLQWELDQAEQSERKAAEELARALDTDLDEDDVAALSDQARERAADERKQAQEAEIEALSLERDTLRSLERARDALAALPPRVRGTADLPPYACDVATAAACRTRVKELREEAAMVGVDSQEVAAQVVATSEDRTAASRWREALQNFSMRIVESCEVEPGPAGALPEGPEAIEARVRDTIVAAQDARRAVDEAGQRVQGAAEALKALAADPGFGVQPGVWKQRLLDATEVLVEHAAGLQSDLMQRMAALEDEIESLEEDRRTLLTSLLAVSDEGVYLLSAVERASRLPESLGCWAGQPFLKVALDVPAGNDERRARLGPLVDDLVEKATIPGGLALVQQAVLRLHGSRPLQATILKPEATRRLERVDVVAMTNFSGGERLTAAVLLYCTLVRLRARRRGQGPALAGNVLLLDNPIGTCSSVPLIELQREVARAMETQLLYTTGVDDLAALAQLPNVVRLRNAHRNRATGDQHVTKEEGEISGVRIVRREEADAGA